MIVLCLLVATSGLAGLLLAGVLVVSQWAIEGIFRHRAGVYVGYAEVLIMLGLIAFILYKSDEVCGRGSRNCIDGGEMVALFAFALVVSLILIVIPLLVLSSVRLSKWSANRAM
jgi:hypothetical protein